MKKMFGFTLILLAIFCFAGCGKQEQKSMVCTLESKDVASGYALKATYKVYYTGDIADSVTTQEVVTTESKELIDKFEQTYNETYGAMQESYGGYDYRVSKTSSSITADVKIDYHKMDLEQYVKDQPAMKNYMTKNKEMSRSGLKAIYESQGATCK